MNTRAAFNREIRILDFAIEREIRKRISPPRNPSSGWISIKKSKSGFFGFSFLTFDWEIRKRICKTVLVNSGVLFVNPFPCVPLSAFLTHPLRQLY